MVPNLPSNTFIYLYVGTLIGCTQTDVKEEDTSTSEMSQTLQPALCPEEGEVSWMSTHGCVLGTESAGIEYFLNIPYASPP